MSAGTIIPPTGTQSAAAALAQVIWTALTGTTPGPWPFDPDSFDWSHLGNMTVSVNGSTGMVTITFANKNGPAFTGTLDLASLEAQLVTTPNFVTNDSTSLGPSNVSLRWDSPPITRQKSGNMFITAEWSGTQSAQALVTCTLYRDFGTLNQVLLDTFEPPPPGGIAPYNWSGHHHKIDVAPDGLPHVYTTIATPSGGSALTATSGFDIFELGGPG
jgi:hypothetical protein